MIADDKYQAAQTSARALTGQQDEQVPETSVNAPIFHQRYRGSKVDNQEPAAMPSVDCAVGAVYQNGLSPVDSPCSALTYSRSIHQ
jgi:hypothetical protein